MDRAERAVRVAMWSGPRNISTALMRSWGNRPDTYVCDEPLYAHYLKTTGIEHPGAAEIIQRYETDWREVVAWLTGPIPGDKAVFYQKHMAHHLLPGMDRSWLDRLTNCFLIREPGEMLTSLSKRLPRPRLADTGLAQQAEIFEMVRRRSGEVPPVIDSKDVLEAPERILRLLCDKIGIEFDRSMLSWPSGPRDTDGIWATHWYGDVERSTAFRPYAPKSEAVPEDLVDLHGRCLEYYEILHGHRLGAS